MSAPYSMASRRMGKVPCSKSFELTPANKIHMDKGAVPREPSGQGWSCYGRHLVLSAAILLRVRPASGRLCPERALRAPSSSFDLWFLVIFFSSLSFFQGPILPPKTNTNDLAELNGEIDS